MNLSEITNSGRVWYSLALLSWYEECKRDLPWRKTRDPYIIWLSEIIFQQTRIDQGTNYFHRFLNTFPDVFSLAKASDDQVMKLWEGLGYYNRARNLHHSAQDVAFNMSGKFPTDYNGLLKLKGVGEYTAASVSSICYGEPQAAIDGNVFRVLSRFYGLSIPIDSGQGKKFFRQLGQLLIDPNHPGEFNQGMMDLGALVCKPRNPRCEDCPLNERCLAYREQNPQDYPVKAHKISVKNRHLKYMLFQSKNGILVKKRNTNDIWQGLYEFYLLEGEISAQSLFPEINTIVPYKVTHLLTHQKLHIEIYHLELDDLSNYNFDGFEFIQLSDLHALAFPKPLATFLQKLLEPLV